MRNGRTVQDVREIILNYCAKCDWVSFQELQIRFALKGPHLLEIPNSNVVIWSGMSLDFVDAIADLLETKKIILCAGSTFSYACDGGILRLPVAKRIPAGGYKSPHWLPMFIRLTKRVKNSEIKKQETLEVGAVLYND